MRRPVAGAGLLSLWMALGCADEAPQEPRPAAVPELAKRLIGSESTPPLQEVRLQKADELRLEIPESLPPPRSWRNVAWSPDSLFVEERGNQTVWQFDRQGRFIRRIRELATGEFIEKPEDIHFSSIRDRLFVATLQGVFVFRPDGALDQELPELSDCHALAEMPDGALLINTSRREGPYWTVIDLNNPKAKPRTFYLMRRKLLPFGKDWLEGHAPHSRAMIDSRGNVFIASTAVREIRVFDSDLNYVGDFRMQDDPQLILPPEKLTPQQEADMEVGIRPDYSIVYQSALVRDEFLVLQYYVPGSRDTRLHFYRLDGTPAFAPIWWAPPLLGCCDEKGRLLAIRRRARDVLDLYELRADE